MGSIIGDGNIDIDGNNNIAIIIKEALRKKEAIMKNIELANFIKYQLEENHNILGGINPNCLYFAGFTKSHLDYLEEDILQILDCMHVKYKFINADNKTAKQIHMEIIGDNVCYDFMGDAVQKALYENEQIYVIKNLSKSKQSKKELMYRGLIKTLDNAHFKNIHPKADLLFIDYASFLEKHFDFIGAYLRTNLFGVSFIQQLEPES